MHISGVKRQSSRGAVGANEDAHVIQTRRVTAPNCLGLSQRGKRSILSSVLDATRKLRRRDEARGHLSECLQNTGKLMAAQIFKAFARLSGVVLELHFGKANDHRAKSKSLDNLPVSNHLRALCLLMSIPIALRVYNRNSNLERSPHIRSRSKWKLPITPSAPLKWERSILEGINAAFRANTIAYLLT
jgi:hypothetical protein